MEEFATKFADLLESTAIKVRSMTVDRITRIIRIVALALVGGALITAALIYLSIALFRLLAVPTTSTGAYAILGGLFLIAGALVWVKRNPKEDDA